MAKLPEILKFRLDRPRPFEAPTRGTGGSRVRPAKTRGSVECPKVGWELEDVGSWFEGSWKCSEGADFKHVC